MKGLGLRFLLGFRCPPATPPKGHLVFAGVLCFVRVCCLVCKHQGMPKQKGRVLNLLMTSIEIEPNPHKPEQYSRSSTQHAVLGLQVRRTCQRQPSKSFLACRRREKNMSYMPLQQRNDGVVSLLLKVYHVGTPATPPPPPTTKHLGPSRAEI